MYNELSIIDMRVWRESAINYDVRKRFDLLHDGETVKEIYAHNIKWEQKRAEKLKDAETLKKHGKLSPRRS